MSSNDSAIDRDTTAPVVSVVMAVNRDDGFLTTAVNSILSQSLENLELLVIANNCSDDLWKNLQTLAANDTRLRPLRTPLGQLPYNLNVGLHHARGEFVARMDADDIALPQRLERQLGFLRANPEICVVGCRYEHIDENSRVIGNPAALRLAPEKIHARMPYESCLPHPTVMMRRADVIQAGGYAYGLYAEDWDLWLRLRRAGKRFANLPELLLRYRIHSGQSTSLQAARRNMANVQALLLRELIISADPRFALSMLRHLGFELLRQVVAFTRRISSSSRASQ